MVLLAAIGTLSGFNEPCSSLAMITHNLGVRAARQFDTTGGSGSAPLELNLENGERVVFGFSENGKKVDKVRFPG